ncbi:probable ribosomal protein S11, mitochondrial isoform X1 [Syzygium oleosum]|uniref:probable ribosomal protein S11, mitochondrial isoform X1 n=1 Tax=Syzygium oleosum TaxID=219896 RepID=UPI0024BB9F86|nr:probable ribosomal protein S11, mitochondrial isoform X1 [Syzygium oleosum]
MSSLSSMNRHAPSLISKIFDSNQRLASSSSPLLQRRQGLTTISHSSAGSAQTGEVISPRMNDVSMIKMYGSACQASKVYKFNNLRTRMVNPSHLSLTRFIHTSTQKDVENSGGPRIMDYVRGIIEEEGKALGGFQFSRYNMEQDVDFVHIKLMRNNTFVTVTDSKGNKKIGASAGCLPEMKGGPKLSRYAAEATAEHVGRLSRSLGLKSVVMKVKGFTYFKKKRQAIMSWREGFTNARGNQNPIVYIEDSTRRPHNGCRLPKRRRV